jgi:predicted nucleic acid-binding Zn finger protein
MKKRIIEKYKGRGRRTVLLVNKEAVLRKERYQYQVTGWSSMYYVKDDACTCPDYVLNGVLCAYIIAVCISTSMNPDFDAYGTEEEA